MAEKKDPKGASPPKEGEAAPSRVDEGDPELDPELLSLQGPRPRVGVLLSLSIISLCVYLMIRIWPDVQFALEDDEPQTIAEAAQTAGMAPERYVEIEGLALDRAAALRVSHSEDPELAAGYRVVPERRTEGALWVAMEGNPRLAPVRHGETHAGRLRALADVPFAEALKERVEALGAPRFAAAEALREAIASGAEAVEAPAGQRIAVRDETPVVITEIVAGEAEITTVATEDHTSAESWAHALAEADILSHVQPPVAAGDDVWVFSAPADAETLNASLREAGLMAAQAEPVERVHEARYAELESSEAALSAGGEAIPWEDMEGVWLEVARPVREGAMLLLAGEHPDDYRHVLWVFALLAAFALLFLWALGDGIRREILARRSAPRPAPPTEKT